jgi:hypothetical protein
MAVAVHPGAMFHRVFNEETTMKTIAATFTNREDAESAVERLLNAGYTRESIGVAMRDPRSSNELAETTGTGDLSAEGATAGVLSGLGVGALVGLALVGSAIVLPGIGPVLVGGSLATGAVTAAGTAAAAATGAGIGAVSGGLIGGLVGAGIPEEDATAYATTIEKGGVLVSVQVPDADSTRARQILLSEGARVQV